MRLQPDDVTLRCAHAFKVLQEIARRPRPEDRGQRESVRTADEGVHDPTMDPNSLLIRHVAAYIARTNEATIKHSEHGMPPPKVSHIRFGAI